MREVKVEARADGPIVNIPTGESKKSITWLIDSGASETVIDEVSFQESFPTETIKSMPKDLTFKSADGSPLQMLGYFTMSFWFGSSKKEGNIYICRGVTKTRLLGSNLLRKFSKWGIDNKRGLFIADGFHSPLITTHGTAPKSCEVHTVERVEVPPRCSRFIKAILPHRYLPSEFIFRPDEKVFQRRRLLLPICLVTNNIFDSTITIKVTNPNSEARILGKGTKLGKVLSDMQEYNFSEGCRNISSVNSVLVESISDMENKLKAENRELYQMYLDAGDIIKGEDRKLLLRLLYKYRNTFSVDDNDIGSTSIVEHRIIPKSDAVVYRRQYKMTEEQREQMDEEVENLLKTGVIRESMSPFNNPVLMVPKKEPGKWRFCLDCRYINDITEDQYFPLPKIDEAMDSLSGSSIFSIFDMTSGYHQCNLEKQSSDMCAFSTRKGHFQYNKLPMGLKGSGMTFQKMVTLLMTGMLYTEVLAYLDDCIVYGKSVVQHLKTLEEVLSRFSSAGLKLKPRKCKLFQSELVYLGYLVNKDGIGPNPERVKLIQELPTPTCVKEVQAFLGKVNYYRKFIPNLAEIAHHLYKLTENKGKNKFEWKEEHQSAFEKLKLILCSGQVMGHPRFDREFILDVDASDNALGVELSQKDDNGNERPVFYGSRHLEKSERSYSATARETLAAVFGCEYFSQYLQGRKFVLRTDHNPLVWLRSMKEPKRPYSSWLVRLEQFEYQIQYRPGSQHVNADFNSRIRVEENEKKYKSISIQTDSSNSSNSNENFSRDQNIIDTDYTPRRGTDIVGKEPNHNMSGTTSEQKNIKTVKNTIDKDNTPDNAQQACNSTTQSEEIVQPPIEILPELQAKDDVIGPVILKMKGINKQLNTKSEKLWRMREKLKLKDGLLVRYQKLRAGLRPIEQIVLPECLKKMVMESLHDSDFAGHFGVKRTMARVKLRYFWPNYFDDVESWCKTCLICQQRKNPPNKNTAPLNSIETGERPFSQIAMDILKLPLTERKNQYLLVIEDYFSKWIEAYPLQRTAAPSVAQCVLNGWVSRYGCPDSILTDQGAEFESNLFKCLNKMLEIKKLRTTPYHPRTDGMVERSNRTLIDILSKYAEKEPNWDLRLPLILFAIRTSEHSTTGFSPFKLTYGCEAKLPWDICYGPSLNEPLPREKWAADRKQEMTKIFKMVRDHTQRAQHHQKSYFDRNRKGTFQEFDVGEEVMLCDPSSRSKDGKLNRPWTGPHVISEKLSEALYKTKLNTGKEIVVNSERLKKFYPRTEQNSQVNEKTECDSEDDDDSEEDVDDRVTTSQPDNIQRDNTNPSNRNDEPGQQAAGASQIVDSSAKEPIMGRRGELWCNINPANALPHGRRTRQN